MIRNHWREPGFWRWYWQNRAPFQVKLLVGVVALGAFLVGGFLAADSLTPADAGVAALSYQTTIERPVTVREHGKTVVRRVQVVRRVVLRPRTAFETLYDTRLVTTPGRTKFVPEKVVRYVPVIRKRVITVNGRTRTMTQTRLVRTTSVRTQTLTNVVTNQQTVVNQSTVTVVNNRTVTVPVTVTDTQTVTPDPVTVTETVPADPVTVTETVTAPSG